MSHPYIPFRTSPLNQSHLHHELAFEIDRTKSRLARYDPNTASVDDRCPLQFSLGVSKRVHATSGSSSSLGILQPPVIFPVLPSQGPGRQVLYVTQYEHLDMLTPSKSEPFARDIVKEALVQHVEFPMLFESSAFLTSPIIRDVNNDGIVDAILTDYDGGIYAMGLAIGRDDNKRYFHKAQVPRLFVRRQWMESLVNETLGLGGPKKEDDEAPDEDPDAPKDESKNDFKDDTHDPYHSYFEYTYGGLHEHEPLVRGVTANVLGLEQKHVATLAERRKRKVSHTTPSEPEVEGEETLDEEMEADGMDPGHRRLQEVVEEPIPNDEGNENTEESQQSEPEQQQVPDSDNNEESQQSEPEQQQPPDGGNENIETERSEPEQQQPLQDEQQNSDAQPLQDEQQNSDASNPDETVDTPSEPEGNTEEQPAEGVEEDARKADAEQAEQAMLMEEKEITAADNEEAIQGGEGANQEMQEDMGEEAVAENMQGDDEYSYRTGDDMMNYPRGDDYVNPYGDDYRGGYRGGDDDYNPYGGDDETRYRGDDEYPRYDDYYGRYDSHRDEYYDEKHYIRITPHILCTPVLVEFPKLYNDNGEVENYLFVAVSYYMDEDQYEGHFSYRRFETGDHGDETEVQRGMYVANALMVYQFGEHSPRWGRQEHLDLSGDHSAPVNTTLVGSVPLHHENTKMGAFALSSPTVADIDGDGNMEVLMGTSMGILYGFDARNLYGKENWPVQFNHGIESRVLVEDVLGDTNLEIFVADVGGNVVCLDHKANKLWHRDLVSSATTAEGSELLASSQMVLGDVDGDGVLDIVIFMKIREPGRHDAHFLFALAANTGNDLPSFPVQIRNADKDAKEGEEFVHQKLPAPLLVDLHSNQDFLKSYLERNGTSWVQPSRSATKSPPHGGNALGLHIVQPVGSDLVVMEAGSGCMQTISIGDPILSMVQADDVHGTNGLDLVISTASGNIITLESQAPFHPLNVWNNGEMRGSTNTFAHGYSASQGIFIHDVSRGFRDIFGVYVPVTFEIFDNRPNIRNEPDKRVYNVEIRAGTSKPLFRKTFSSTGIYTERFYIPYGPGFYTLSIVMKSTHGLVYEDTFHVGYNVNYLGGFAALLWVPLLLASIALFACGRRTRHWDDDDYEPEDGRRGAGILGAPIS